MSDRNRLRRDVEAVRTINADNEPLRELLDEILSEHPTQTGSERGWRPPTWREIVSQPPTLISPPATQESASLASPQPEERQIASAGAWAIASDGIQWIVRRYRGNRWRSLKFVRTTKTVLARCLREAGASVVDIDALLDGLPDEFSAPAAIRESLEAAE
jgi:hypothetical protein